MQLLMTMTKNFGRSPHGERGLKFEAGLQCQQVRLRRSPHGERGLKSYRSPVTQKSCRSLSSWRAWIEMEADAKNLLRLMSLSSWRAWIEIGRIRPDRQRSGRRSPHGERGLKCTVRIRAPGRRASLSSWRAWIEIALHRRACEKYRRSPHGERGLK